MNKTFCDIKTCKKVITRNMITDRLVVRFGDFTAVVMVTKNKPAGDDALCYSCLIKGLNQKPTRKYERKPPLPKEVRPDGEGGFTKDDTLGLPDISTFSYKVPERDTKPYTLSLGGHSVIAMILRDGVAELMEHYGIDQKYIESASQSEGKRLMLNILNPTS